MNVNASDPIDRHDLDSVKELMKAEFRTVETRLDGMAEALKVQAHDREKKDEELNDVRSRFVPRAEFEQYKSSQSSARRAVIIAIAVVAIGVAGLIVDIVNRGGQP